MSRAMVELEIKDRLDGRKRRDVLERFQFSTPTRIVDRYYDSASGDLYQAAVFVRVRNGRRVDIKQNPDAEKSHEQSLETSFGLPLTKSAQSSLTQHLLRYLHADEAQRIIAEIMAGAPGSLTEIVKVRQEAVPQDGAVLCVDDVERLGSFIEVEASSPQGLATWARDLGLVNLPVGYVELALMDENRELYEKGHYRLPSAGTDGGRS